MTSKILKPHERAISLTNVSRRVNYLQGLITDAHNILIDTDKLMDRTRLYSFITGAVKLIHDMQSDSNLEDLEQRLTELEEQYKKAQESSNNR